MTDLITENARLRAALEHIIAMNVREAKDRYGIEDRAESMACVVVARAALATSAKPTPDAVQETSPGVTVGADYAAGFAEGIRRAAELPAYDCDGDPCGAFDNPIFVKRDAILALTPSSQEVSHDRT